MSKDLLQFYIDNTNDSTFFTNLSKIVPIDIVQKNPGKPWDYKSLSMNPNVTWNFILANKNKPWDYKDERDPQMNRSLLSINPNITWDIVKANPDINWCYGQLISNPNITEDIIKANPDKLNYPRCNYKITLNNNPNLTIEFMQEKRWISSFDICRNRYVTFEIFKANRDKGWKINPLSANPNITWEIIKANPDIPWCYKEMSSNPNITWDIVKANPDKEWDYTALSNNPNITWDIIKANPDKPWDYIGLSFNPKITLDIVMNNTDRAWFMITEIKMYKLQRMIELQQFTIERITKTKDDILKKLEDQIKFNEQLCDIIFEKKEEKFREKRSLIVD
jgi:hypothetical protein